MKSIFNLTRWKQSFNKSTLQRQHRETYIMAQHKESGFSKQDIITSSVKKCILKIKIIWYYPITVKEINLIVIGYFYALN
jgi:hypothetical protein